MPLEEMKTSSDAAFYTLGRLEAILNSAIGTLETPAEGYKATAQKRKALELLLQGLAAIRELDNHIKPKEN